MIQDDLQELEFEIPRNIKAGQSFYGLNTKGWIYFLSTSLPLSGLTIGAYYLALKEFNLAGTTPLVVTIGALGLIFGISYMSFEMDEKTGEMKIDFLLERFGWLFSEKVINPTWGDDEYGKIVFEQNDKEESKESLSLEDHDELFKIERVK